MQSPNAVPFPREQIQAAAAVNRRKTNKLTAALISHLAGTGAGKRRRQPTGY